MFDETTKLEEKIAHLTRTVDELNEVVARQELDIALLKRRVEMLLTRETARELSDGNMAVFGDERPPHY